MPKPGVPESFKVLIKELQSLALDVKVLDAAGEEIDLKQTFEDDDDLIVNNVPEDETLDNQVVADHLDGYGLEDENGDAVDDDELFLDREPDDDEIDALDIDDDLM